MDKEKIYLWASVSVIAAALLGVGYLTVKYVLSAILPFVLAWVIALLTRAPADKIARKTGAPKKLIRAALFTVIMLAVVGGFVFLIVKIATECWELLTSAGESGALSAAIASLTEPFERFLRGIGLPSELEGAIENSISDIASALISKSAATLSAVAGSVPRIVFFVFITVIAGVYFSVDLEKINGFVRGILPQNLEKRLVSFKNATFSVLLRYFGSYMIITSITFSVLFVGLLLIKSPYALLLAAVAALLDALPLIGIGIILIPYAVIEFIRGSIGAAIALLVLYGACTAIREIAEPKIVGKSLGIHPLLTLILIYIGLRLFGIAGMIILPLCAVVIGQISRQK